MEIIRFFPEELTKREVYKLTSNPDNISLKNAYGAVINVDAFIVFDDEQLDRTTGEVRTVRICAIRDKDGTTYATNSSFFTETLCNIFDTVYDPEDDEPILVEVMEGMSKNNRPFTMCKLV